MRYPRTITDVHVGGTIGGLQFRRIYSSRSSDWKDDAPFDNTPTPFGAGFDDDWAPQWWHSALALVTTSDTVWSVRERGGKLLRFMPCSGTPCWTSSAVGNTSIPERLQRTSTGFTLWAANGEQLLFEDAFSRPGDAGMLVDGGVSIDRFFLSQVRTVSGKTAVELAYQAPSGLTCPAGGSGTGSGVPYLYELRSPEAILRFTYSTLTRLDGGAPECVIRSVDLVPPSGSSATVAAYEYLADAGGLLSTATLAGRIETYGYDTTSFTASQEGVVLTTHTFSSGRVTGDVWSQGDWSVSWDAGSCQSGLSCCGQVPVMSIVQDNTAQQGDGTTGSAGLVTTYLTVPDDGRTHNPRIYQTEDVCAVSGACSPGTIRTEWTCSIQGRPGYELGTKNKRGNWETFTWATVDAGAGSTPILEKTSSSRGASLMTGYDALETESYSYVYGSGNQQLVSTTARVSTLSAGNNTVEKRWYDSNNRLQKVTRAGYTADSSGTVSQKVIATFYSTSRTCGASAGPDALDRTLEVRGPCFVSTESATSCPSTHPVTVYEYYSSSETNSNRNRLYRVRRYANGSDDCSSGTPLTTTYSNYDALGNAGTITDENDNEQTNELDTAGRVTARTLAAKTRRFAYESDKLVRVMYPEGNGEVFCYRTGGNDDCTTGSFTPLLQWRAKKACTGTTSFSCTGGWSERVNYSYAADGTVSREEYRSCAVGSSCTSGTGGTLRRVLKFSNDAHRRSTWRGVGDATGEYKSVSFFDRADNLAGVGHAFNDAPAFCGGPNASLPDEPTSKLCSWLRYDRAERLQGVEEFPSSSVTEGIKTCFAHDAHGNISKVVSGCQKTLLRQPPSDLRSEAQVLFRGEPRVASLREDRREPLHVLSQRPGSRAMHRQELRTPFERHVSSSSGPAAGGRRRRPDYAESATSLVHDFPAEPEDRTGRLGIIRGSA